VNLLWRGLSERKISPPKNLATQLVKGLQPDWPLKICHPIGQKFHSAMSGRKK